MSEFQHNHEQESQVYYDKIAGKFDKTWDGFLSSFFKKFIVKNLVIAENSAVLDIGCANGTLLAMLHEKTPFYGTGLDISPEMIKVAKNTRHDFNFFTGSAQELPFPDNSFDVLICSASFHHFPDPEEALAELHRVLRPEGKLVIAEIRIPFYDVRNVYNHYTQKHSQEGDVKVYGQRELENLFQVANFAISEKKMSFQIQYYELKKL